MRVFDPYYLDAVAYDDYVETGRCILGNMYNTLAGAAGSTFTVLNGKHGNVVWSQGAAVSQASPLDFELVNGVYVISTGAPPGKWTLGILKVRE